MRRVTLRDVAAHAGVSTSAASLAVRGVGRLSEETRNRVKASMEELGYVYHRGAATLRSQTSVVVGLIVTDISNPFFSAMALGFESALSGRGYITVLMNTFDDAARFNALVREMHEYPVAALGYVPVAGADLSFASGSANGGPPCLALTRDPGSRLAYLGVDNRRAGGLAAEHLITLHGRKRLVYLGGPEHAGPRSKRLEGVRKEVARHPDVKIVAQLPGTTSIASGVELASELLSSRVKYDAVICHSDVIAYALCHALRLRNIDVPRDASVIGFDNLDMSGVFAPPLSSVAADPRRTGEMAAEWIVAAMRDGDATARQLIAPRLEPRESCGCRAS